MNPTLLKWMKGFYQSSEDFSLDGVDDGMKRYSELVDEKDSESVIKESFESNQGEPSKYLIWLVVLFVVGLILYVTDANIFILSVIINYLWKPIKKYFIKKKI